MLISKPFSVGDIVSLKLVNGDEIIGRYEEETDSYYGINKPMAITITGQGLGLIPWMFFAETETYKINKNHVFVVSRSKEEAASQYLQGTTGIALK